MKLWEVMVMAAADQCTPPIRVDTEGRVIYSPDVEELRRENAALKGELAALREWVRGAIAEADGTYTFPSCKVKTTTNIVACGTGCCPTCGSWMEGYCCVCGSYNETTPAAAPKKPEVPVSVGVFDEHRGCWYPAEGKREELGKLLGEEWTWDSYYGGFFGPGT